MRGDLGDATFVLAIFAHVCAQKKNRSGTVTVAVVDKSYGRFWKIHNWGCNGTGACYYLDANNVLYFFGSPVGRNITFG